MADPYVYEGTTVLKNLASIRDQDKLDEFESTMVQLALVKLYKESIDVASARSIFEIHKALFSNVYEWAGEKRTINIYKHEQILAGLSVEYSKFGDIDMQLSSVDSEIQKYNWDYISEKKKIEKITRIISSIWQIHPFREGNTRAVATFLFFFMKDKGLKLNTEFLSNNAKFFRNALVLASIGQYSEYQHLETILRDSVIPVEKPAKPDSEKYSTIRGYNLEYYKYNYHSMQDQQTKG